MAEIPDFVQHLGVISDRGSKYAVSGGRVRSQAEIKAFLKQLKRTKKFAKATHNTWAARLPDGTEIKNDDGEGGALKQRLSIVSCFQTCRLTLH